MFEGFIDEFLQNDTAIQFVLENSLLLYTSVPVR